MVRRRNPADNESPQLEQIDRRPKRSSNQSMAPTHRRSQLMTPYQKIVSAWCDAADQLIATLDVDLTAHYESEEFLRFACKVQENLLVMSKLGRIVINESPHRPTRNKPEDN
jgi:hypothetical protein